MVAMVPIAVVALGTSSKVSKKDLMDWKSEEISESSTPLHCKDRLRLFKEVWTTKEISAI